MGQRDRARPRQPRTAADDRGDRRRVVRRDERGPGDQPAVGQQPHERVDRRHLDRDLALEIGQQPGQPRGEHRLAGAGRPDHEEVVTAGRRDLDRPSRLLLSGDIGQVQQWPRGDTGRGTRCDTTTISALRDVQIIEVFEVGQQELRHRLAPVVADQLGERADRPDVDALDEASLVGVGPRDHDLTQPGPGRREDRREHAADRPDPAVEPELADVDDVAHFALREEIGGGEHRDGDGEVERRAGLRQVGRLQVDRQPAQREGQPGVVDRGPHPVAGLAERGVRQADDGEGRQAGRGIGLDVDHLAG